MIHILGVMTGTSCDGLDASCVGFNDEGKFEPIWEVSRPYPPALRKRVLAYQKPGAKPSLKDWLELDRDLGEWYGQTLKKMLTQQAVKPDAIANHGQTVGHFPASRRQGTTCQLGDPSRIAHWTGLTTISHFRSGDLAAGGQGAPLVPLYHQVLARQLGGEGIAIHNIGGISNLTYLGPENRVIAFDTGPGNLWLDAATEEQSKGKLRFDRDGKLALQGEPDWKAIEKILRHPFFKKRAPKSTGRDDFPFELLKKSTRARGKDLIATALWITVESIAQAYEKQILSAGLPLETLLLCGGGAKNPTLLEALRSRLTEIEIEPLTSLGIQPQFVEAQAFAFFGFLALRGFSLGGAWTGAQDFGSPAHLIPGKNWGELLGRVRQLPQVAPGEPEKAISTPW